jgi:glycerol uptake facilitator-like aquaporin
MKNRTLLICLFTIFVLTTSAIINCEIVYANGELTETEYSTSISEATGIVRIIVAIFGGIIGVLGIYVTLKNVIGKSDISLSISETKSAKFTNLTQGVVITIIGAAILIGAVYLLPDKKKERHIKGKEIIFEKTSDGETMKFKK